MLLYTNNLDLRDEARQGLASRQGIHLGVCYFGTALGTGNRSGISTDHGALLSPWFYGKFIRHTPWSDYTRRFYVSAISARQNATCLGTTNWNRRFLS